MLISAITLSLLVAVNPLAVTATTASRVGTRGGIPYIRQKDFASSTAGSTWLSIDEDSQFLPVESTLELIESLQEKEQRPKKRKLPEEDENEQGNYVWTDDDATNGKMKTNENGWKRYNPYDVHPFVDGMSDYDGYQQAWRMLGFMIDCNDSSNDENNNNGGGHGDEETNGCSRYVVWAAYVDLEYEGGGIGEYQYWDRTSQRWNDTSCLYASFEDEDGQDGGDGSSRQSRCAKMDCHLENTHFSLLGFFKHRSYDDWMEQLFKHEGYCVWTEDEYEFMADARDAWPQGCSDTGSTVTLVEADEEKGIEEVTSSLYYDIKPLPNGRLGLGLYTDTTCIEEYTSTSKASDVSYIEDLIGNFLVDGDDHRDENADDSGESLAESLERWNSAFDVWHTCQPCVAYDLSNVYGNTYTDDYYYYNDDRRTDRDLNGQGDAFECYDDAGYTNVNQVRVSMWPPTTFSFTSLCYC